MGPISPQQPLKPPHTPISLPCPMSLFSTISVRRSGKEPFVRNTYLAQRQSPVPTPFISPGDGIQYTKTPSCSSITPALGIRAGLPGNWLVVDEHKVWDYPWRSGDYRKGVEGLRGVWQCFSTSLLPQCPPAPPAHSIYSRTNMHVRWLTCLLYILASATNHLWLIRAVPVAQCNPPHGHPTPAPHPPNPKPGVHILHLVCKIH